MAKDLYHQQLRTALEKEGWTITHDPFKLQRGNVRLQVDLGAERLLAAQKGKEKIAIEVKTFRRLSLINAFHSALGQYLNYRRVLTLSDKERKLYLAIPVSVYRWFMSELFYKEAIDYEQIKIIAFNPHDENIEAWIK